MMTANEFANIVIPAVLVALASIGVFALAELQKWLKTKTTAQEFDLIQTLAEAGARAAQQYLSGADGKTKKEYALKFAVDELQRRGVKIDPARLDAWIEGAVARMKDAR